MSDKEHRDVYIAAIVGGLGLVLIYLYMHSSPAQLQVADASGSNVPQAAGVAGASIPQNAYNYNVAPYDPGPPIQFAFPPIPGSQSSGGNITIGAPGGCCNQCGPRTGNAYNDNTTAQFSTLLGTGAG
jgi:hypothetical protein